MDKPKVGNISGNKLSCIIGKIRLWGEGYYSGIEENAAGKDTVANYLTNVYGKELN